MEDENKDAKMEDVNKGGKRKGRRKSKGSKRGSSSKSRDELDPGTNPGQGMANAMISSMVATPIGLTRKTLRYNIKKPYGTHPLELRVTSPFDGLFSYRKQSNIATQAASLSDVHYKLAGSRVNEDVCSLMVSDSAKFGDVIFPTAAGGNIFRDIVWPTISNILTSGIKADITISNNTFMRILCRVHWCMVRIYYMNTLLMLWEQAKLDPASETSRHIMKFVQKSGLVKAANRSILADVSSTLLTMPCLPGIVQESKRMLTPFIDPSRPDTLIIPTPMRHARLVAAIDYRINKQDWARALLGDIDNCINDLNGDLANEISFIKAFMPNSIASEGALVPMPAVIDVIRAVGYYNSSPIVKDISGNSGATMLGGVWLTLLSFSSYFRDVSYPPSAEFVSTRKLTTASGDLGKMNYFMTADREPNLAEFASSSVHGFQITGVNNAYVLISPHFMGEIFIPLDDTLDILESSSVALVGVLTMDAGIAGIQTADVNDYFWRTVGCKYIGRASNTIITRYPQYTQSVLDVQNLFAYLFQYYKDILVLPGYQMLDLAQQGQFLGRTPPGASEVTRGQ